MPYNHIIEEHRNFSAAKVEELIGLTVENQNLTKQNDLVVFATGAFARFEANPYSGIDIFLIKLSNQENEQLIGKNKDDIDRHLADSIFKIGLPSLSDAHASLKIHYLNEILDSMVTSRDFYSNSFEIRMLFFLESIPIFNQSLYKVIGKKMITSYLENFPKQGKTTLPVFMINDIIRFWKTISLNYQHRRNYNQDIDCWDSFIYLRNLKLAFSKKLASYSFIIQLLLIKNDLTSDTIFRILEMKPLDRLYLLRDQKPGLNQLVDDIVGLYTEFLHLYNQPYETLSEFILDKNKRTHVFEIGQEVFSGKLLQLILKVTDDTPHSLRYLLI